MSQWLPPSAELLEQAPDAIVLVDASGVIAYANGRVTSFFGRAPGDLIGRPVETLVPPKLRQQHAAHRGAYERDPGIRPMSDRSMALHGLRADGTEFPVDIHLAPIRVNRDFWTLAVIRDATERQRIHDELRAAKLLADDVARTKGQFLAFAAHDLSQPQQTLELLVNAIERQLEKGSDLAELALQASSALVRMRELLKMLIEISRLESGTLKVLDQPTSVAEILGELERHFGPQARAKALRFESAPSEHVVETDPALLRGILSNLVGNAIRYTQRGEVKVSCATAPDGGLQFAVSDTGIGIPADQIQGIFDDFHRLEAARHAHRDGFGLGLGIVRRLSDLLGFPVTVESAVGRGSTFRVTIPASRVNPSPRAESARRGATVPSAIG